jgi:hypothetical protein
VCESDRFEAGSVMVCAGICHDGRTQLKIVQGTLNAVKYICNILDSIVLPFLLQRNFDHVVQHDNVRCHVACVCQDFLNQNQIRVPPWPHYHRSCHQLNIYVVNSVVDVLGSQNQPETLRELRDALVHEWNHIPQTFIQRLIGSMRQRCEAVVAARSGHTRY